MATTTLEEKINKIRQQNEEIRRRHEEVEADKKNAAELNALVQMVPSSDWPERKEPPEFVDPPLRNNHKPKPSTREHRGHQQQYQAGAGDRKRIHVFAEGDGPPPDPSYNFLADSEREERVKVDMRENERGRGRGGPPRGASRKRGTERDASMKQDYRGPHPGSRDAPDYEAWRAERNRIDEARISRQRTAEGNWRREWDNDKVKVEDETSSSMPSGRPTIGDAIRRDHKDFDRRHQFDAVAEHGAPRGRGGNHRSPRGAPRGSHNGRGYHHSTSLDQFHGPVSPTHKPGQNTGLLTNLAAPLSPTGSDDRTVFATEKSIKVTLNHGATIPKGPVMSVKVSPQSIAGTGRVGPRQKSRILYSSQSEAEVTTQELEAFPPQKLIEDKPGYVRFNHDNNGQQRRVAQIPNQSWKTEGNQKSPHPQRKEFKNDAPAPMSPQRRAGREPKSPYLQRKDFKNDALGPVSPQWRGEHEQKLSYSQREQNNDVPAPASPQWRGEREPKSPYLQRKELKNDAPAPMSPQKRRESAYSAKKEVKNDAVSPQGREEYEPKSPKKNMSGSQKSTNPQRKPESADSYPHRRANEAPRPQRQLSEKSRKSAQIQKKVVTGTQGKSKETKDAEGNEDGTKIESSENAADFSEETTKNICDTYGEGKMAELTDKASEETKQNLLSDIDCKSTAEGFMNQDILQDSETGNENGNELVLESSTNQNNELCTTGTVQEIRNLQEDARQGNSKETRDDRNEDGTENESRGNAADFSEETTKNICDTYGEGKMAELTDKASEETKQNLPSDIDCKNTAEGFMNQDILQDSETGSENGNELVVESSTNQNNELCTTGTVQEIGNLQKDARQGNSKETKDDRNEDGTKIESGGNAADFSEETTKNICDTYGEGKMAKLTDKASEETMDVDGNGQQNLPSDIDCKNTAEGFMNQDILQDSETGNENGNKLVSESSTNQNNELCATGTVQEIVQQVSGIIATTKGENAEVVSEEAVETVNKNSKSKIISGVLTKDATESSDNEFCDNNKLEIMNKISHRSNDSQTSEAVEETVTEDGEIDKKLSEPSDGSKSVVINDEIKDVDNSDLSKGAAEVATDLQSKRNEKTVNDQEVHQVVNGKTDSHGKPAISINDQSENQRNENVAVNDTTIEHDSINAPKSLNEKSVNDDTSVNEDNIEKIHVNGQT